MFSCMLYWPNPSLYSADCKHLMVVSGWVFLSGEGLDLYPALAAVVCICWQTEPALKSTQQIRSVLVCCTLVEPGCYISVTPDKNLLALASQTYIGNGAFYSLNDFKTFIEGRHMAPQRSFRECEDSSHIL